MDSNIKNTLSPVEINFSHYLFAFNPCIPQVKWHLTMLGTVKDL